MHHYNLIKSLQKNGIYINIKKINNDTIHINYIFEEHNDNLTLIRIS